MIPGEFLYWHKQVFERGPNFVKIYFEKPTGRSSLKFVIGRDLVACYCIYIKTAMIMIIGVNWLFDRSNFLKDGKQICQGNALDSVLLLHTNSPKKGEVDSKPCK